MGAADQHAVRAQRDRAEHINAGADTAIDKYRDLALDGLSYRGQDFRRGGDAALNAPAVVGDDYGLRASLDGPSARPPESLCP